VEPAVTGNAPIDPRILHLERLRARIAAGEPMAGDLAATFALAATALDPMATEETLVRLGGNGGVELYRSLVAWAGLAPRERVLDIGCGSGGATREAVRAVGPDGSVIGVDASSEAVAAARERTPPELGVDYRILRAEHLHGIPDRSVDCITASLVLEQLADLPLAAGEMYRVLRPGGRIVASVMDFDQFRPADAAFFGAVVAVVAWHARGALSGRASRATLPRDPQDRSAFQHAGFATIEERDVQLIAVLETEDDAWALFSRSMIGQLLGPLGRLDLRGVLAAHVPHTLYLPVRFLRTRRPG
jgi:ubiquinone/menaquinone biosynthesis C-methylase UbiE